MQRKFNVLVFLLLLGSQITFGQSKTITGTVVDSEGQTLPGATIILVGTTQGTVTDIDGKYSINATPGDQLQFSYIGYQNLFKTVGKESIINVQMMDSSEALDELVVVGYGIQKKESVVGAIATVDVDKMKEQGNISNMTDALTGMMPGVSVLSSSSTPGGGAGLGGYTSQSSEILVRGKSTWNNAAPLVLVDGIERSMNDIDVNEVKSISVLKDASATAIFGVKGGNGVILITTHSGVEGKTKLSVEANITFEQPSNILSATNTVDGVMARNYAIERTRRTAPNVWDKMLSDEEVSYFRNQTYPYAYPDYNWQDILLDEYAQSHRINLTASGGTQNVKYFTAFSYNHVGDITNISDIGQGYNPEFSYNRFNFRSNFDFNITKFTKLSVNLAGIYAVQQGPSSAYGTSKTLYRLVYRQPGDIPILVYEDGVYGSHDTNYLTYGSNAYLNFHFKGLASNPQTQINTDYTLEQKLDFITKGLTFSGKFAYDNTLYASGRGINDAGVLTKSIDKNFYLNGGYFDEITKTYMIYDAALGTSSPADMDQYTAYISSNGDVSIGKTGFDWMKEPNTFSPEILNQSKLSNSKRNNYYELRLNYKVLLNSVHDISAMAMFSRQESHILKDWPSKREDWVGRLTYSYDGRYFAEANGAYNGSEMFGPGYKFDFFPSFAGGWVLSNEQFFEDNVDWIDLLKLRFSYGKVGNDRVKSGNWPYLTIWSPDGIQSEFGYPTQSSFYTPYIEGVPGNPNLHWEVAKKINYGVEFNALNNRVAFTVDVFKERRTDMLLGENDRATTVPIIFGQTAPAANVGEAKSSGAELEITLRNHHQSGISYWISANWAVARSEIISKETPILKPDYQKPEGKPIGQSFSGLGIGMYDSWDDIYINPGGQSIANNQSLLPGDMIMLDYNADGLYNNNTDDVPYMYPVYPQNNYGFSFGGDYKGFQISLRFAGFYNVTRLITPYPFREGSSSIFDYLLADTWSPEYGNSNPTFPGLFLEEKPYKPMGNYNLWDGSLLKLQTAQISYTLPKKWIEPMRLNQLRFYLSGNNLLTWTKMPTDGIGSDFDDDKYPTRRGITIGLNLQF